MCHLKREHTEAVPYGRQKGCELTAVEFHLRLGVTSVTHFDVTQFYV